MWFVMSLCVTRSFALSVLSGTRNSELVGTVGVHVCLRITSSVHERGI